MFGFKRDIEQLGLDGVEVYDELVSTNDKAREPRYRDGDIIVAEYQSGGRGQRGNKWVSDPGCNLTFSLVVEPRGLCAANSFYLSEAVSLAVCDSLAKYGINAMIKWPNDIYVDDRKIAGILIENDISGRFVKRSIAGIGLNVNQESFPAELPNPVSMIQSGPITNRAVMLGHLKYELCKYIDLLNLQEHGIIERSYLAKLYRIGRFCSYRLPGNVEKSGCIEGVLPSGEIMIRWQEGVTGCYAFKEVEYVI